MKLKQISQLFPASLLPLCLLAILFSISLVSISLAAPSGKSTLGDFIWYDIDGDGLKDAGELGINGVLVNLYQDTNLNGVPDAGEFVESMRTTDDVNGDGDDTGPTNGAGFYDFSVTGGQGVVFIVEVDASNFASGGALEDYVYSGDNGDIAPYNGTMPRVILYPEIQADKNDVDFPFYKMSLGNYVWDDLNYDGDADPGEPAFGNVPVALVNQAGQVVDTTTTDSSGYYTFTGMIAGTYVISVTPPLGYSSSTGVNQEADPDSNGDQNDNGLDTPVNGAIVSAPFVMQPNDPGALNNNVLTLAEASTHNPTIDFGLIKYIDLSLIKQLKAGQSPRIRAGDDATFIITIRNQGLIRASNIVVTDYIPVSFSLSPLETDWNGGPTGAVTHSLSASLNPQQSTSVDIILRANNPLTPGNYTNIAEISAVTDGNGNPVEDIDSTPDSTPGNDGTPKDDVTDENHKDNPNDDEDDSDPADILVVNPGLQISKVLNTHEDVLTGATVTFTVKITNTGDILITYLPLQDRYDTGYLEYVSAQAPSDDNINDGNISWSDLTVPYGDLAPDAVISVIMTFTATTDTSELNAQRSCVRNGETCNQVRTEGQNGEPPLSDPDGSGGLPPISIPPDEDEDDVLIFNPTAVMFADRSATIVTNGVQVDWTTINEVEFTGFEVWRQRDEGDPEKASTKMIEARHTGQAQGASYRFLDTPAVMGLTPTDYLYSLQVFMVDGNSETYVIGKPQVRNSRATKDTFLPFFSQ